MMKKLLSHGWILLLAGLLGLLVSCAPAEIDNRPVPTPQPRIVGPTSEADAYRLAIYTPSPEPKKEPHPGKIALEISEVSISGDPTAKRLKGIEGEWIELHNISGAAVDISDYSLSDREDNVLELVPSKRTLLPDAYMLIALTEDSPFGLKAGETVYLFENATYAYDSLEIPDPANYTFGRNENGETVFFRYATPGGANLIGYPVGTPMSDFDLTSVYISEICAADGDDWIEIRNGSSAPVDLTGWHISRHKAELNALELSGMLEPGGYYVTGGLKLPATGDTLFLTDGNGFLRDTYATGVLAKGVTSGRDAQTGQRRFYTKPTKGADNASDAYDGFASEIFFSENCLFQAGPFTLTLSARDAEIYYTLDGSSPKEHGKLYTGPISVNKYTVLRAYTKKEGCLDSEEVIRHFIFDEKHNVPTVCLTMDADDFKKVYKAKERNQIVEKLCLLSYYSAEGQYNTCMSCSVKAKGRGSLSYAQKSLTFKLRKRFGTSKTEYPLFGTDVNEGIRYRAFCLRTGGQDCNRAIIRDTVTNRASQNTAVDAVKTQPAVLYVNGEYMGLFMLQEEMNADYYVSHYGLDKTQIDVINQNGGVRSGTLDGYSALRKTARKSGKSSADYEKLCSMLDIEAYTDYCAIQLIVGNTDVLNQKVVQSRDGKLLFRPMLFDEDSAFGSKKTDLMYKYFKSAGFTPSSSDQILCNNDVFKALYRFPNWRTKFWHRTVELLNTEFSPENLNRIIDALVAEIEPEMPRQIKKYHFHDSVSAWKGKVNELKSIISARKAVVYDQLINYFNINSTDIRNYEQELKNNA